MICELTVCIKSHPSILDEHDLFVVDLVRLCQGSDNIGPTVVE